MENLNLCGPYLKQFRLAKQMKLDDVSALLRLKYNISLDRTNIGRAENGKRYVNDIELVAFAEIYGVTLKELLPMAWDDKL